MKKALILALALSILGWFPLLGLTGTIPLYLGSVPYSVVFGEGHFSTDVENLGDRAWPLALILAGIGPWGIPASFALSNFISDRFHFKRHLILSTFFLILLLLQSGLGAIGLMITTYF